MHYIVCAGINMDSQYTVMIHLSHFMHSLVVSALSHALSNCLALLTGRYQLFTVCIRQLAAVSFLSICRKMHALSKAIHNWLPYICFLPCAHLVQNMTMKHAILPGFVNVHQ